MLTMADNTEQAIQELIIKKILNQASLDNKFFVWGRLREPVIAENIRNLYPNFDLQEEHRVYHSTLRPGYMASPDMIGQINGQPFLVEIKTSKNNLLLPDVLDRTGYFFSVSGKCL